MPISTNGLNETAEGLRRLASPDWAISETAVWVDEQVTELGSKDYPPPRPRQRYIRTYLLQRSYKSEKRGEIVWEITNTASGRSGDYSGYVVGERQAWMHAGRWWQVFPTVENNVPELQTRLGNAAIRVVGVS